MERPAVACAVRRLPKETWRDALLFTVEDWQYDEADKSYTFYRSIGESPEDAVWLTCADLGIKRSAERDKLFESK